MLVVIVFHSGKFSQNHIRLKMSLCNLIDFVKKTYPYLGIWTQRAMDWFRPLTNQFIHHNLHFGGPPNLEDFNSGPKHFVRSYKDLMVDLQNLLPHATQKTKEQIQMRDVQDENKELKSRLRELEEQLRAQDSEGMPPKKKRRRRS